MGIVFLFLFFILSVSEIPITETSHKIKSELHLYLTTFACDFNQNGLSWLSDYDLICNEFYINNNHYMYSILRKKCALTHI